MVSRVTYRPFEDSDFNDIAKILQTAWHTQAPTPGYGFLEACCDLADVLAISSFSQVALIDGKPSGIVLTRGGHVHRRMAARWSVATEDFTRQIRASEPEAAERFLAMNQRVKEVNTAMLDATTLPKGYEITLLIVGENARGLGIGSVLLDAATSYLVAHGAKKAFLYTDADCDWKFYEHRGYQRMNTYRAARSERKLLPRELYLYGMDLTS